LTDVGNQFALRRLDLQEQLVTTVRKVQQFGGMTMAADGTLLLIEGDQLLWLDADGKPQKSLKLALEEELRAVGGAGASLALDEKHERLYATGFGSKRWYIWHWNLRDGAFTGVLPIGDPAKVRGKSQPGPFVGTNLYGEGSVFFGPDDPEHRYLYTARVDTYCLFRLDLEQQEIWAMTTAPRAKGEPLVCYFVGRGDAAKVEVYAGAKFTPSGDILSSRHSPFTATRLKRIQ
jgi:hypothetical protein